MQFCEYKYFGDKISERSLKLIIFFYLYSALYVIHIQRHSVIENHKLADSFSEFVRNPRVSL